jgi:hypothetical protein
MKPNQTLTIRSIWSLTALIALVFLLTGLAPYISEWQRGTIGVALEPNELGEMILSPMPGREANLAGVQQGDILLSIAGVDLPIGTSVEETIARLRGPLGEPVAITVRHIDGTQESLSIIRSEQFLAQIASAGVSAGFLQNYSIILFLLVPLIFFGLSARVIWMGNTKIITILTGFVLLLIPYSLNLTDLASFGADWLNAYWLYAFLRAAGLLGIALFLLLFPTGRFFPAWARWLAILTGIWILPFYASQIIDNLLPTFVVDWAWILIFAAGIVTLLFRFRTSEPIAAEKGSLDKILLAGVVTLGFYALIWLLNQFLPWSFFASPAGIWFDIIRQLAWSAVAIFLGIQMARATR